MKNIIVWNDLPLFYPVTEKALKILDGLFDYSDSRCQCTYISYRDTFDWAESAGKDGITIGTRPGKIFGFTHNITTIRRKTADGYAVETYLTDDSTEWLRTYIKRLKSNIIIYDDASVEGNTLRAVIEIIRKESNLPIQIKLLCASELVVQQLLSEYKDVTIDAQFLIPGMPIKDCTVLFISDLINDDPIFSLPFICNKKLMYPCFYEKYEEIRNTLCSLVVSERILPYYKMMIRETLFITDLDGTLFDCESVSEYQYHKLKSMIDEGVPITVATSRSEHGMRRCLKGAAPLLPTIHYNGALIYDQNSGTILDVHTFRTSDSAAILEHSHTIKAHVLCICLINGTDVAIAVNSTDAFSSISDDCGVSSFEELKKADNIIAIYEYTDCPPFVGNHSVYSSDGVNQYTALESDKGKAALLLSNKLGFKKIIAFGDDDNDYPISKVAHRFYAFQHGKYHGSSERDVLMLIERECEAIYENL